MWPFQSIKHEYQAVASHEDEPKEVREAREASRRDRRRLWVCGMLLVVLPTLVGVGLFATTLALADLSNPSEPDHPSEAAETKQTGGTGCPRRCEWRSLSNAKQQEYISAVLCLRDQPSTLVPESNKTAYDDFPWIHSRVGYFTHNSAPFLPWHRYFLHIYETTLREKCGYEGSLVYWDWTLDWDALEHSPVFDAETGFGGDGEVGGELTVSQTGRCVVDGPFAGIIADYYDVKYQPHCLSRGFRDLEGNLGHIDGHEISPKSIEEVLSLDSYESFVALMESRVHDAIPYGISGDFETFTAPYDPLFFLHHTQLDRLWWLWQQRQPDNGVTAYGGHKQRHSLEMASLDDLIVMHGLAPDIKVNEFMDIQGDMLCYSY